MNVCLLNDSFPPVIDGVANAVLNYAKIINNNYGSATVATPSYPDADDSGFDFNVIRYPSINTTKLLGYRTGMPLSAEIFGKLDDVPFDVIHSHCPVMSTILARSLREVLNAPLIFTYHTKFDIDIAKALRGKLLQESAVSLLVENISAYDEVWAVSEGAGENLKKLGYDGDYVVMPNGVDLPKGRVSDEKINAVSEGIDLPDRMPVFLFVGRMMWYKGIKISLDALKTLKELGKDFRMIFIGGGGDKDDIMKYCSSLGLNDKVTFMSPVYDRELIRAWYCRADLFLFPSTFDTNGLVVREAAACALGSVLIKNSCASEGVKDGINGFLIDENSDSMAFLLLSLIENPEKIKSVGQNAQRDLYMSWEESVKNAYERYLTVVHNYRSGYYPSRKKLTDDFFRTAGEYLSAVSKANDMMHSATDEYHAKLLKASAKLKSVRDEFNDSAKNYYNAFIDRFE